MPKPFGGLKILEAYGLLTTYLVPIINPPSHCPSMSVSTSFFQKGKKIVSKTNPEAKFTEISRKIYRKLIANKHLTLTP